MSQNTARAFGDYSHMSLNDLCDHIVTTTHHARLKGELRRIGLMLCRVTERQRRHPENEQSAATLQRFAGDLKLHLSKEEEILFPLIMELEEAGTFCGHLSTLIERQTEDAQTCKTLQQIRELTRDFSPPGDACETYRTVLTALSDLEQEVHEHSGVENNVLFPAAWQMEQDQMAKWFDCSLTGV